MMSYLTNLVEDPLDLSTSPNPNLKDDEENNISADQPDLDNLLQLEWRRGDRDERGFYQHRRSERWLYTRDRYEDDPVPERDPTPHEVKPWVAESGRRTERIRSDLRNGVQLGYLPYGTEMATSPEMHDLRQEHLEMARRDPDEWGWFATMGKAWHDTPFAAITFGTKDPTHPYHYMYDGIFDIFSDYSPQTGFYGGDDPNFQMTEKQFRSVVQDFPPKWHSTIRASGSMEELYHNLDFVLNAIKREDEIAASGPVTATTASIAAYLIDPYYYVGGTVVAPLGAVTRARSISLNLGRAGTYSTTQGVLRGAPRFGATIGSRLTSAGLQGTRTAITVAGVGTVQQQFDPSYTDQALVQHTTFAAGLGGAVGAVWRGGTWGRNWRSDQVYQQNLRTNFWKANQMVVDDLEMMLRPGRLPNSTINVQYNQKTGVWEWTDLGVVPGQPYSPLAVRVDPVTGRESFVPDFRPNPDYPHTLPSPEVSVPTRYTGHDTAFSGTVIRIPISPLSSAGPVRFSPEGVPTGSAGKPKRVKGYRDDPKFKELNARKKELNQLVLRANTPDKADRAKYIEERREITARLKEIRYGVDVPSAPPEPWAEFTKGDGTVGDVLHGKDPDGKAIVDLEIKYPNGDTRLFRLTPEDWDALKGQLEGSTRGVAGEKGVTGRNVVDLPDSAVPQAGPDDTISINSPEEQTLWDNIHVGPEPPADIERPAVWGPDAPGVTKLTPVEPTAAPAPAPADAPSTTLPWLETVSAADAVVVPRFVETSKPKYRSATPEFDSPLDKALYIVGGTKKLSAKDEKFMEFAMEATGLSRDEVRAAGRQIRDTMKGLYDADADTFRVPRQYDAPAPVDPDAPPAPPGEEAPAPAPVDPDAPPAPPGEEAPAPAPVDPDAPPAPPVDPQAGTPQPPEGMDIGQLVPAQKSIWLNRLWSSGKWSLLRTKATWIRSRENDFLRAIGNWLMEDPYMGNTWPRIATEMKDINTMQAFLPLREARPSTGLALSRGQRFQDEQNGIDFRTGVTSSPEQAEYFEVVRAMYKTIFDEMQARGEIGPDVTYDPNYMSRGWRESVMSKWAHEHGGGDLAKGRRVLAKNISDAYIGTDLQPATKDRIFLHVVRLFSDRQYRELQLIKVHDINTWEKLVENMVGKFGPGTDDNLRIEVLQGIADDIAPRPTLSPFKHARHRLELNEGHSWVNDGKTYDLVDIFQNGLEAQSLRYLERWNGHKEWSAGLQTLKDGFGQHAKDNMRFNDIDGNPLSKEDHDALVDKFMDEINPSEWTPRELLDLTRRIGDAAGLGEPLDLVSDESIWSVYRELHGFPAHKGEHTTINALMKTLSDFAYYKVAGVFGWAQGVEYAPLIAEGGLAAVRHSIPFYNRTMNLIKEGNFTESHFLYDMMQHTTIATEYQAGLQWSRNNSPEEYHHEFGRGLQWVMDSLKSGKALVAMNPGGIMPIDFALRKSAQHIINDSFMKMAGRIDSDGNFTHRQGWGKELTRTMRDLGLSEELLVEIVKNFKNNVFTAPVVPGGPSVMRMDWDKWDPWVRDAFLQAQFRWANRLVLRVRPGNLPPIFDRPEIRFLRQFTETVQVAIPKMVGYNATRHDIRALKTLLYNSAIGSMMYIAQEELKVQANLASGYYDELEAQTHRRTMMSNERIVAEMIRRNTFMGPTPALIDAASGEFNWDIQLGAYETNLQRGIMPPGLSKVGSAVKTIGDLGEDSWTTTTTELFAPNLPFIYDFLKGYGKTP